MKRITQLLASALLVAVSAQAKIITVNTANNADFSAGKTNLVTAIRSLADSDTIAFNIPGAGPHYLLTPVDGYPLITNNSVTIDGYSQPGAVPNSNPIHAANNAQLKIVLSSTNGNGIAIEVAAQATVAYTFQHPGFNANDNAILAVFRGTNTWIKGLVFQGVCGTAAGVYQGTPGPLHGICFMADEPGQEPWPNANGGNWHVSGCWFGLDPATRQPVFSPDGSLATPIHGIDTERNRNQPVTTVNYPGPGTIGVAVGSADPRAEFNIFLSPVAAVLTGTGWRISGNFFNVLPDGMHNYDMAYMPEAATILNSGIGDATIIIARQGDNVVIGTDGNGVNDDQEGNVFGGASAYPLNNPAGAKYRMIDAFYGPSPSTPTQGTNNVIAGNYFGVAVDGATRFTNASPIWSGFPSTGSMRVGSDFDGVSDALEANLIFNNYPFTTHFATPGSGGDLTPESTFDGRAGSGNQNFTGINTGERFSFRGNVAVGNDLLPYKYANGFSSLLTAFTNYSTPYMDVASPNGIIPTLMTTNLFPTLTGKFAPGIGIYTNITVDVYELDPEGWANGKLFTEPELQNSADSSYFGFPQGKKYLGTFAVANTGFFSINLPPSAGFVTVTVNYSADPAGTHNGRVHTSNFSNPTAVLPAGATSVGLTQVVPDVACWFDTVANTVTNGPIILANQPIVATLGNWEPYISSLGDSTFLVEFNTYANDGLAANQNNAVAKQPAAGGAAKVDYAFYGDNGTPFKGALNLSRQNGNPGKVAGDPRYGANKFITEAEVSLGQLPEFNVVPRWGNNDIYTGINRYAAEQIFTLNTTTLVQTPVTNAWDYVYGNYVGVMGTNNNSPQVGRTGGRPNFLDNGNIVVMTDDKSCILSSSDNEVITFSIIQPNGTIVKNATLASTQDIFDNMCAVKGGFVIRAHNSLLFYNNSGTLTFSNDCNTSSGLNFGGSADAGGRGDGIRINGDIRSYYVYVAGTAPGGGGSSEVAVGAWDTRTGQFAGSSTVTDGDPALQQCDRAGIAVDALDRVCVAYMYKADKNVFGYQVVARVAQFDGKNFNWQTHSFYPFVNHDQNPASVLGYATLNPYVAMNTRQICIAAKGTINNVNNVAAGPNSLTEQTVYTVVSHPAPVAAPRPNVTMTKSGSNLNLSWNPDDGLFTVQTRSSLNSGSWANATAGNVATPVTISAGSADSVYVRLVR